MDTLPNDFVYLRDVAPQIQQEIHFASSNNFIGRPIPGYNAAECILNKTTAKALIKVQQELKKRFNYSLRVYDCYRPARSIESFTAWEANPLDIKNKSTYYPNLSKQDLFRMGFIGRSNVHSLGNTVDVSIIDNKTSQLLPMGTIVDFFDPLSYPSNRAVGEVAFKNRQFLKNIMGKYGFEGEKVTWWHFSLKQKPYPTQYYNFTIEPRKGSTATKK